MNLKINMNICRICLNPNGGRSFIEDSEIIEKFQYSTQLKLSKSNDGMPTVICKRCESRLKIAYDFKMQAIISDAHLRAFINRVNDEFKDVTNKTLAENKKFGEESEETNEILLQAGYALSESTTKVRLEQHNNQTFSINHIVENCLQNDQNEEETIDNDDDRDDQIFISEYIENEMDVHNNETTYTDSNNRDVKEVKEFQIIEQEEFVVSSSSPSMMVCNSNEKQSVKHNQEAVSTIEIVSASNSLNEQLDFTDETQKHENRSNICIKCDRDFSSKTNLMRHMLSHDGIKPYQCTVCGNGFTQSGSLKQHMLIHTGERPYKCNVCGRGFTQGKSLKFHVRRHTGEKPFTCYLCGSTFRQKDGLKRHMSIKHTDAEQKSSICAICSRTLPSKYSLQVHMKKHAAQSDPPHICKICRKMFGSKKSLEIHQLQHIGQKPHKCSECGREFSRKGALSTHLKAHLQSVLYKCDKCSEEFPSKYLLSLHKQNTHSPSCGAKAFQCGKCLKSFAIKNNLLQHLRNHNKDNMTMYKCDECSIAFNTKRDLKLHRFNEHKESVSDLNECDICNIPFVSVNDLNQHLNTIHDKIDEKCQICMEHFTSKKLFKNHQLHHEYEILPT